MGLKPSIFPNNFLLFFLYIIKSFLMIQDVYCMEWHTNLAKVVSSLMTKSAARLVPMSTMHLFVAAIQICRTWKKKKITRWSFIEEKKGVILSNCCCHSVRIAGAVSPCLSRLYFRCYFIHKLYQEVDSIFSNVN